MKIKLTIIAVFLLAGCTALSPRNENGYPPAVVENVISSCEKTAGATKICPCMAEKVQKRFPYDEFVEIDKKLAKGETPKEFAEFAKVAAQECANEIKK